MLGVRGRWPGAPFFHSGDPMIKLNTFAGTALLLALAVPHAGALAQEVRQDSAQRAPEIASTWSPRPIRLRSKPAMKS
jgi:hypothetical protein